MPVHVVYIISHINKSLEFEWLIDRLDKQRFALSFILLNPEGVCELSQYAQKQGIPVHAVFLGGKKDYPAALWKCYRLLRQLKPAIVHAHLFDASLIGLSAAWLARIPHRIYTRHHSSWHHVYFPGMVKYDRFINAMSTCIVAISEGVKKILIEKENVPEAKIALIHHGIETDRFDAVSEGEVEALRAKYNPLSRRPIVGIISRYTAWKGIQYIIPAFQELLKTHPTALLILANAKGEYEESIHKLLSQLPPESYTEIAFEPNLFALYRLFDVFVHAPIDDHSEAFGQIYIEALAARVPSIFTLSGAALGFAKHLKNCYVADYQSSQSILDGLLYWLNGAALSDVQMNMVIEGRRIVEEEYHVQTKIARLEALYLRTLSSYLPKNIPSSKIEPTL